MLKLQGKQEEDLKGETEEIHRMGIYEEGKNRPMKIMLSTQATTQKHIKITGEVYNKKYKNSLQMAMSRDDQENNSLNHPLKVRISCRNMITKQKKYKEE